MSLQLNEETETKKKFPNSHSEFYQLIKEKNRFLSFCINNLIDANQNCINPKCPKLPIIQFD